TSGLVRVVGTVTLTTDIPGAYALEQNFPNPFNPTTTISFQLPAASKVSLKIYDLLGREIQTLVNGEMNPGTHQVSFEASTLASGIYFYRLNAGMYTATRKLVLLK
ncbi:MAG TPA: T9SS type A sorting domain-containing protein, partial [Terriglobia bacterium]|nr:T9SS type A sorting domain-containing protein [Terriglobia bacterium]